MGKKKKKDKKKKTEDKKKKGEDDTQDLDIAPVVSLDNALHSAKKTETTLQSLMKEVSEEKGYVKKEEEEKIRPQLSHESRNEIAEAYALEDIPITQRKQLPTKKRTPLTTKPEEKVESSESEEQKPKSTIPPKIEVEVTTVPSSVEKETVDSSEDIAQTPKIQEVPVDKKVNIYLKLTEFFEDLLNGYNERYERWENSISNILAIMRKMRKITKKNTDDLEVSIQNLYKKIQAELELFKIKRSEVERVAEVDMQSMSGEFKRVLGLLELQVKEYQLKRVTDELIHELRH